MSTYVQSLSITSITNDTSGNASGKDSIATVKGQFITDSGSTTDVYNPNGNYNFYLNEYSKTDGSLVGSDPNVNVTLSSDGTYTLTYDSTKFALPAGYKLEVATTDTSSGRAVSSNPYSQTTTIDGYLSGAKLFVDTNGNGVQDSGEYSVLTDASGNAFLPSNTGTIISSGGTDTLTGLAFTGSLTAASGSSVVTPLTTLVNLVARANGGNVSAAQAAVINALGLSSSTDIDNFDPIAATQAGTPGAAAALAQSAAVIDTAKLITAAGATGNPLATIAAQIASSGGTLDLTDASVVARLASASGLSSSAASEIGQIAAASNSAVVQAAATNSTDVGAILNAVAAITRVAQGTTASQVAAAGGDPSKLALVVAANTGSALQNEIGQSLSSPIITGGATNNSVTDVSQALQNFLSAATQQYSGAPIGYITGASGSTVGFDGQIGIVTPDANLHVKLSQSADIFASGGSNVDLSGTPRVDGKGDRIAASVTLGDGNNRVRLNHGPSLAQSSTGNDTLISGGGHDTLWGGFGHDSLRGGGHSEMAGGVVSGDTLHGGLYANSHDTIYAGVGRDLIITNQGYNLIYGNRHDTIQAGFAQDTIFAGSGPETIHGGHNAEIYGGGRSFMDDGVSNTYFATGADTIHGSNYNQTVNIQSDANGVTIDGRTGNGQLDVNVAAGGQGSDTLFGGFNTNATSDVTVHVTQAFTVQQNLDQNNLHVVQLQGGQTLHVDHVVIDFNGTKTQI